MKELLSKFSLPVSCLSALLVFVQGGMAQGRTEAVQIGRSSYLEGLRNDVRDLQQKVFEEEQRFGRLMRLKIHWDLLLPVRDEDLFEGTTLPSKSAEDLASELAAEIRKEVHLKTRFRRRGGIDSDTPLPRIKDVNLVPPPAPGSAAKRSGGASVAPTMDQPEDRPPFRRIRPKAGNPRFGPFLARSLKIGPTLDRSQALTPFGGGQELTLLVPSTFLSKRVRALIGAGMATEALAVLGARLEILKEGKQDPEPSLLYLKAKTLESLGEMDQAKEIYAQVTQLDQGTNAEGAGVFGIWAKSANFALEHLRWLETNSDYIPPDLEQLK